jgi:hypothetical protein
MDLWSESKAASGSLTRFIRSTLGISLAVENLAQYRPFSGEANERIGRESPLAIRPAQKEM